MLRLVYTGTALQNVAPRIYRNCFTKCCALYIKELLYKMLRLVYTGTALQNSSLFEHLDQSPSCNFGSDANKWHLTRMRDLSTPKLRTHLCTNYIHSNTCPVWVTDTVLYCYIQGVPGGMCQTSGECSLSHWGRGYLNCLNARSRGF